MKIINDMAHIPYIAHLKRMHEAYVREEQLKKQIHKAYKQEKSLKHLLILTNGLWLAGAILSFVMR